MSTCTSFPPGRLQSVGHVTQRGVGYTIINNYIRHNNIMSVNCHRKFQVASDKPTDWTQ